MPCGVSVGVTRASTPSISSSARAASAHTCFAALGVHAVDEGQPDRRTQSAVDDGPRDGRGMPVHVPEPDGAAADHLEAGEAGSPVDVVGVEAGLRGPDLLFEPLHEREVAAVAAEQRHGRVGVPVHEPGRRAPGRTRREPRRPDRARRRDRLATMTPSTTRTPTGTPSRRAFVTVRLTSPAPGARARARAAGAARFAAVPASNSSLVSGAAPSPFARLSTMHTGAYASPTPHAAVHSEADRHPHHVREARQQADLGRRLEARPGRLPVHAPVDDRVVVPHGVPRREHACAPAGVERGNEVAAFAGGHRHGPARERDEVARSDERADRVFEAQRSHRRDREHAVAPELAQRVACSRRGRCRWGWT